MKLFSTLRRLHDQSFVPRWAHTAMLSKVATLIAILIHSLCLLPRYALFYDSPWLSKNYAGLLDYPALLRMLEGMNNVANVRFFVAAELLTLVAALRFRASPWPLLPVIFFSTNIYHVIWAVQDGGNNLTHINIIYLLLVTAGTSAVWEGFCNAGNNAAVCLLRGQLIVMYFCAAMSKIQGDMWQNGTALYYTLQNDYFGSPWARDVVVRWPVVSTLGTYGAILFQLTFCFLVLNRKARYPLLVVGSLFHLGIATGMNLHLFSLTMVLAYACFFDDARAKSLLEYLLPTTQLAIAYDQTCRPCRAFRRIVDTLGAGPRIDAQWAQEPRSLDLQACEEKARLARIHASAGGRLMTGFAALSAAIRRTVVGPIFVPVLALFEFTPAGEWVYNLVAKTRAHFGCASDTCQIS